MTRFEFILLLLSQVYAVSAWNKVYKPLRKLQDNEVLGFSTNSTSSGAEESLLDSPLRPYGVPITVPFPNNETLLGIGGIAYNAQDNVWTCSAESIVGMEKDTYYPLAPKPRLYHLRLDFDRGILEHTKNYTLIDPGDGLKVEDLAMVVMDGATNETSFWLASEANSNLVKTSRYLSKDFGSPDLSTFDPAAFTTSRLVRVNMDGKIVEEAFVPEFAQWDMQYNWNSNECFGDRPFQGFHALTITSSQSDNTSHMLVGTQAALYQDGQTSNKYSGSRTRILHYSIDASNNNNSSSTATYLRSYRYDLSTLSIQSSQKSAKHFNGLFGMLALSESEIIVVELEDFNGFGTRTVIQRMFYTQLDLSASVDHCVSLNNCDVQAGPKYLIWEGNLNYHLDAIGFGPSLLQDGQEIPTIALAFEDNFNIGARFELYTLDLERLREFAAKAEPYATSSDTDQLLRQRTIALFGSLVGILVLFGFQLWLVHRESRRQDSSRNNDASTDDKKEDCGNEGQSSKTASSASSIFSFDYYLLGTSMMNSFLVGGVTFGFPGLALMLRKEGCYADSCACGSFCAAEKEQLALVSTMGFFVNFGSRIFLGLLLDAQGPKVTAIVSGIASLAGAILLAAGDDLKQVTVYSWSLLALGGSGLHTAGFHVTNLFSGTGKKIAAAALDAAFGASSVIFAILQVVNQYADVGLQDLASGYSVVVSLVLLNNFLVQPWNRVEPGGSVTRDLQFWHSEWWKRNFNRKPFFSDACGHTAKFEFWGECLHYSMNLLLLTYYLSTVAQLMYEKGDAKFTNEPNSWTDFMFTKAAGWMISVGFLWFPIVQLVLKKLEWPGCFAFVCSANIIVVSIVLIPVLEIQIPAMAILSLARLALFSYHHAFIIDKFGMKVFGTLSGLSSLIAATIGLLNYPLQLLALRSGFAISFIPIAIGVVLSALFPFFLRRRSE